MGTSNWAEGKSEMPPNHMGDGYGLDPLGPTCTEIT